VARLPAGQEAIAFDFHEILLAFTMLAAAASIDHTADDAGAEIAYNRYNTIEIFIIADPIVKIFYVFFMIIGSIPLNDAGFEISD